jgi:hypothetical protein
MELVRRLKEEQAKLGLSDRAFARRLGVSSALWATTKSGKAPVGRKLMAATVREFPLLANDIVHHLSQVA